MAKSSAHPRRVPERTCVACRARGQKRSLVRLVRTPEGRVEVDPTGRRSGRGAYLCASRPCWEAALQRRALNRALRTVLTAAEIGQLREYAQTLPVLPGPTGPEEGPAKDIEN